MNKYTVSWNYLNTYLSENGERISELGEIYNDYEDLDISANSISEAKQKATEQIKELVCENWDILLDMRKNNGSDYDPEIYDSMVIEFDESNIEFYSIELEED